LPAIYYRSAQNSENTQEERKTTASKKILHQEKQK
jgi:hypothetical protein